MSNNVIDAAIRLRYLFTPTVRSVNASLDTMKTKMAAAKQSVNGMRWKNAIEKSLYYSLRLFPYTRVYSIDLKSSFPIAGLKWNSAPILYLKYL